MNYFVYVVCGGKEYISELNYSLKFLRHYSKYPVVVLTDSSRNEIPIEHDVIIDVKTPETYQNHQAHLFLETQLPHFVDLKDDDCYCYLDSDVIAISPEINDVFNEFIAPVRFARDHCTIDYFSPGVMKCRCKDEFALMEKQFHVLQNYFPEYDHDDPEAAAAHQKLVGIFSEMKKKPFVNLGKIINYLCFRYIKSTNTLQFGGDYYFNKDDFCWYTNTGKLIDYDYEHFKRQLWKKHHIRLKNNKWVNSHGRELNPQLPYCNCLRDHIRKQYHIKIPAGWQHWNGGVFLFTKQSIEFMDLWHRYTMAEFDLNKIKTYDDQGTLAVCAWKFNIKNMKPLPVKYNFITDIGNKNVRYDPDKGYTYNNFKTTFAPAFLHVYHHWGSMDWSIWQAVTDHAKRLNIR